MNQRLPLLACILLATRFLAAQPAPPAPYGPLPSARQLQWHEMELYCLMHFTPTTFEDKEWGFGDANPALFNPTAFDARHIASTVRAAGFKGLILVAKHHDGFCLWPTKTTPHNISKSPWRNGKGDMVKAMEQACRQQGLRFGIYCSPWDRNHPDYGRPAYVDAYRQQLRELYTGYGPLFMSWHDGANGGDGYYGGTRETRRIDPATYYGWDSTWALTRSLQPGACIFSDIGPDVRWIGNESGYAPPTSWHTFSPHGPESGKLPAPGYSNYHESPAGQRDGRYWVPAECDVPLRPGWFYHPAEDHRIKSPDELFHIYLHSVGNGAALDLGIAPDKRGRLHPNDVSALQGFGRRLRQTFSRNLAAGAVVEAANTRGRLAAFSPRHLLDDNRYSYWATDDSVRTTQLVFRWQKTRRFNIIQLRENIRLGQRIDSVAIDHWNGSSWEWIAGATSIGSNRLIRLDRYLNTARLRLRILRAAACPALSTFALYAEPEQLATPVFRRTREGDITISATSAVSAIRYTTDGSTPGPKSPVYTPPVSLPKGGTVTARCFDAKGHAGPVAKAQFGLPKKAWRILATSFESPTDGQASHAIDEDPGTLWHTWVNAQTMQAPPQWIAIDMGSEQEIAAFTLLPRQRGSWGIPGSYRFETSKDGMQWNTVATGEFANIKANPVEQIIRLKLPEKARYFRFTGLSCVEDHYISVAELGVLGF